ncbi:diguanylate cyclase [Aliamphritea spongicola]|uniref:diguanylate cyclase n=1 Tax=Aliamphritea spongicola TaxID=707589 RepID=UPI00196A20EC|nr:diguanylate cyclase [Aliamphritea spongicola]MBN3562420.1 diguanylate cyclase [Aliamphritea spongicola]
MKDPVQNTVYGDFNCPFCYALHEHLAAHDWLTDVRWKLIEHAPDAQIREFTLDEQVELASEVATVRHRAPEIHIALPPIRSNTRRANQLAASLELLHPEKVPAFRLAVYRALWQQGRDIAQEQVLLALLSECGLTASEIQNYNLAQREALLREWQAGWEDPVFQRRIPILQHHNSRAMLGLSSVTEILAYLSGNEKMLSCEVASCSFKPRPIIALLGSLSEHWHFIEPLRNEYDIRVMGSYQQLADHLNSPESLDLVLLTGTPDSEANLACIELIQQRNLQQLSVVFLDTGYISATEALSYRLCYSDYLHPELQAEVFSARSRRLISLKQLADQYQQLSNRDHLTQLYNRREFEHLLELEWLRVTRAKRPLSVLIIDIDHFKRYNDKHGHLAGDNCLRATAKLIAKSVNRPADMAFRYGGEEFILLLPETPMNGAIRVAENLQQLLRDENPHRDDDKICDITVSIGIATSAKAHDPSPYELVQLADEQLLAAKAAGRNRYLATEQS